MKRNVNLATLPADALAAIEAHRKACMADAVQNARDLLLVPNRGAAIGVLNRIAAAKGAQAAGEVEKMVRGIRAGTVKMERFK